MSLQFCPQCGSELATPDTETAPLRCPSCGAALDPARDLASSSDALPIREAIVREEEEDASATRAATREQFAPIIAQAAADHQRALASAGRRGEGGEGGEGGTQELPLSALPLSALPHEDISAADSAHMRGVTAELPLSAQSAAPPDTAGRSSVTRVWRAISATLAALVLVAVVIVAALAANGVIGGTTAANAPATPTASVAPTATTALVASFTVPGLYQISHPQGWVSQQRNAPPQSYFALLTAPTGNASLNIEAQQAAAAGPLDQLDQRYLDQLSQPGSTPTASGAASGVTIDGQQWTQLTADVTLRVDVGQPAQYAHAVALSTQRGAYVYTIVYLAPSASAAAAGPAFATANQQFFQPMLASFTFLS